MVALIKCKFFRSILTFNLSGKVSYMLVICITLICLNNICRKLTCVPGLNLWGLIWCAFGDNWRWDGPWFRMAAVAVGAWSSGQLLHGITTLPPLLAALLTGIFARNFNILDMRDYTEIDAFLR